MPSHRDSLTTILAALAIMNSVLLYTGPIGVIALTLIRIACTGGALRIDIATGGLALVALICNYYLAMVTIGDLAFYSALIFLTVDGFRYLAR